MSHNKNKPKVFKCILCEQEHDNKKIAATVGNNLIPRELICETCVKDNYCWATDKELKQHNYSIIESRRQELRQSI